MPDLAVNPLLLPWDTPFGLPPFAQIHAAHFAPALDAAMKDHWREVEAIAGNVDAPTFDNTITALDRSGALLKRASRVFFNLTASHTSPELQA